MRLPDDWGMPQYLLVTLVVVGLLTLVVAGSTSSQAFGVFNSGWDGASGVQSAADADATVDVATQTAQYDDAGGETIAIVLAPTEPYTDAERARLRAFLDRGGTLVVAEDVGAGGNRLLEALGTGIRFDGRLVIDQRYHGPTVEMPRATNVSESMSAAGVDSVMLNHGTALTNTTNATVLVRTSSFSALDTNGNGAVDDDEPLRSYPIAARDAVGAGTVIAVSDPSVFINAMQSRASNAAFTSALVGGFDHVLLDVSHADAQPPVRAALLWLRRTPLALFALGVAGLSVVARAARGGLFPRRRDSNADRTAVDEQSLRAYVAEEHPDWDVARARRAIGGVISTDENTPQDSDDA